MSGGAKMINRFSFTKKLMIFGILAALMMGFAVPVAAAPAGNITPEQAKEIALGVYPGAEVIKAELETSRRAGSYFEVKLIIDDVKVEVKVDAATGEIREGYEKNLFEVATITPAQAHEIALRLHPEATITKTELEYEKGTLVYEISLRQSSGKKAGVYIDAATGEVLKNKAK